MSTCNKNALELKSGDGKSSVTIDASHDMAGIWVCNEHGTVGIVSQADKPPYIAMYGNGFNCVPALAITPDEGNHDAVLQIHGPNGKHDARFVSLKAIVDLLGKFGSIVS